MQKTATFANAYTPQYFDRHHRKLSVSTWTVKASCSPFRMVDSDLLEDRAIFHDLTNRTLLDLGYDLEARSPAAAAEILWKIAISVDFCLFEFFLSDLTGHKQDMNEAAAVISSLDRFMEALLQSIDLEHHTVLLTSDHGNLEDITVATHTLNTVPTVIWGKHSSRMMQTLGRIEDIYAAIVAYFSV